MVIHSSSPTYSRSTFIPFTCAGFNSPPHHNFRELQSGMENYEVVGLIGKGSFGSVSKIRRKDDGRILVWKEMNYGTMEEKEKQLLVQV